MKWKTLGQNLLLAALSVTIVLLCADFVIRQLNGFHYRRKAEVFRKQLPSNSDLIGIHTNRFMTDLEKRVLTEKTPLILFVGDSITLGYGLKSIRHAYSELFDADISAASGGEREYFARNISGMGSNINDEARVFRDVLGRFPVRPEVLVLGYCLNDIFFSVDEEKRGLVPILKLLAESRELDTSHRDVYINYYSMGKNRRMVKDAFSDIAATAKKHDAKPVVVLFPFFVDSGTGEYPYLDIHKQVASYAEEAGLEALDLYPFYERFKLSSFMTRNDFTHPGPLGHKFAADIIYHHFSTGGILPLPEVAAIPGLKKETRTKRAAEFCDSLFSGEMGFGRSSCGRVLRKLISEGKIFSGAVPGFFMIDWASPAAAAHRSGDGD